MSNAIEVEGLVKHFGEVKALDGVDFTVPTGTVVGLLGPNGAGKTTAVRVLTTLLYPTAGRATVVGHNVVAHADQVRKVIGLSGQYAAVDEILTGRENLEMVGGLYHMSRADQKQRAHDLLERFDLLEAADRPAKTYSGGMRRRLDLAGALVARPQVMVLDEPTTGLDPRSRIGMWDVIRELVAEGATLLLTTQYLEEADLLANSIVVIDHGKVIARGTSDELKAQVGGERVEVVVTNREQLASAADVMRRVAGADAEVNPDDRRVTVPTSATGGAAALLEVVRDLDAAAVGIDDVLLRRPTLDDVFLALTGHAAEDETATPALAGRKER